MNKKIKPSGIILRDGAADHMRRAMADAPPAPGYEPVHIPVSSVQGQGVYLAGMVYEIPVSDIHENNLNARAYYGYSDIDTIGQSMLANGQEVPARGYSEGSQVFLIDGQKRWRGAKNIGFTSLRVEICEKPKSERDAYLESRRINLERSEQTALDDAVRFKYLLDNKIFSGQVELGAAIGLDQGGVSKIMSINAIPERTKRRMQDYPQLSQLRVACAISKIFRNEDLLQEGRGDESLNNSGKDDVLGYGMETSPVVLPGSEMGGKGKLTIPLGKEAAEILADSVIDEIIRSELSARQVEDLVKSRLSEPKTKVRSQIQNYTFAGQTVTVKVLSSMGKLDLSVKGLSPDKLELLHLKMQELLKGEGV